MIVSEPNIRELPASLTGRPHVRMSHDVHAAIAEAGILVLLVNHRPYNDVQRAELDGKILIDTRGGWS